MNKQTEALKMVEQLRIKSSMILGGEKISPFSECYLMEAVADYLEALEQPQEYLTRAQQVIRANNSAQEPVAKGFIRSLVSIDKNGIETWKEEPFYTSPPSWQGLSDDEVKIIQGGFCKGQYYVPDLVRAIEQALKEKNAKV